MVCREVASVSIPAEADAFAGNSGHFWPLSDKSRLCSFRVSDFGLWQCLGRMLSGAARFAEGRATISAICGVGAAYAGKRGYGAQMLAAAPKSSKEAGSEVEYICRQMLPGCWLTMLEYNVGKKPLLLQGQAVDALALENFVEQLQKCGNYSRVELLQSEQQGNIVVYKLQLKLKEGKQ